MHLLNKSFQSQNADPTKLLNDTENCVNYLKQFVLNPTTDIDIFSTDFQENVCLSRYLGFSFETRLKELQNIDNKTENCIRNNCVNFVVHLILQLKKRFPENFKMLKTVNLLSVENVLRQNKDSVIPLLSTFSINNDLIDLINSHYNSISYIKCMESSSTTLFWSEVFNYKDSAGNNPFKELAGFALDILSLPWSNADVERVFSQLNLVKTKLRNRLLTSTVNAVLHVRYGLKLSDKCCFDYKVPTDVLKEVGTNAMYTENVNDWANIFDNT